MNLSSQQHDFVQAVRNTDDSIALEATAGSGKTSALVAAIKSTNVDVACCAFNTKIANELKQKMPDNAVCKTLHSFGLSACFRQLGEYPKLVERKTLNITNDSDVARLVAVAKHAGLVVEGTPYNPPSLVPDTLDSWLALADQYDIDIEHESTIELARATLLKSCEQFITDSIVDFDDMLYMPTILESNFNRFSLLVVDEAQDLSPLQHKTLSLMMRDRIICAGDKNQAVYGFRGSDYFSMDNLVKMFNCKTMPLTVSFRCPRNVVKEAKKWVPRIEPHPDAPPGVVRSLSAWHPNMFSAGDVVLCRNTKPLVRMAFNLLKHKVPCYVLGRDVGQNLTKLANKFKKSKDMSSFLAKLEDWRSSQCEKLSAKQRWQKLQALCDRVDSLQAIASNVSSVDSLLSSINKLFSESKSGVLLSTIHKFKGNEANRVFLLDMHLIPSQYAKLPWQIQQEINLAYVAITRAKHTLTYIGGHDGSKTHFVDE